MYSVYTWKNTSSAIQHTYNTCSRHNIHSTHRAHTQNTQMATHISILKALRSLARENYWTLFNRVFLKLISESFLPLPTSNPDSWWLSAPWHTLWEWLLQEIFLQGVNYYIGCHEMTPNLWVEDTHHHWHNQQMRNSTSKLCRERWGLWQVLKTVLLPSRVQVLPFMYR